MSISKKKIFGLIAAVVLMLGSIPITNALANSKDDVSSQKEAMASMDNHQEYRMVEGSSSTCCP